MSGDGESSLVCEGAGYDEVFLSGHGPEEGLSWSLEREMSAHSPIEEVEDNNGEEVEEREVDEEYDESEGEKR